MEELNAQLVSLVGENGAEMLISAFRSRKSISGPDLAGKAFNRLRLKVVCKGNGKDVLWCLYTLRFNTC